MGNQPAGWLPPPYTRVYACAAYYFLDADNPAAVVPGALQLAAFSGAVIPHGEWQTLLDFTPMGGFPGWTQYWGLSIPAWGMNQFYLEGYETGEVLPTGYELIIEAPTVIPPAAFAFNWNNTQTWTWQQVGYATLGLTPGPMGAYAAALYTPATGPLGFVPQNVVGVMMQYLRLRLVTSPVVAPSNSGHLAFPFGISVCNPVADAWSIVGA